jgi:hypothetical protein
MMPAQQHHDQRCPDCGAHLIVMRFSERISYHCRTHGPFLLDDDGNLARLERRLGGTNRLMNRTPING